MLVGPVVATFPRTLKMFGNIALTLFEQNIIVLQYYFIRPLFMLWPLSLFIAYKNLIGKMLTFREKVIHQITLTILLVRFRPLVGENLLMLEVVHISLCDVLGHQSKIRASSFSTSLPMWKRRECVMA